MDLPIPTLWRPAGAAAPQPVPAGAVLSAMNDQHAYLKLKPEGFDPQVGDLVCCGISHPCTTFDSWRGMTLVEDDYRVTAPSGPSSDGRHVVTLIRLAPAAACASACAAAAGLAQRSVVAVRAGRPPRRHPRHRRELARRAGVSSRRSSGPAGLRLRDSARLHGAAGAEPGRQPLPAPPSPGRRADDDEPDRRRCRTAR